MTFNKSYFVIWFLCGVLLLSPGLLLADTLPLAEAKDCEEAKLTVKQYDELVQRFDELSANKKRELLEVYDMVCSGRFAVCGFVICTLDTGANPYIPMPSVTAVVDPLAWLNQRMDCEKFREQIKVRYGPLGSYGELPAGKKEELGTVLDLACSARFAHCDFSNCKDQGKPEKKKDTEKAKVEPKPKEPKEISTKTPEELQEEEIEKARVDLQKAYNAYVAKLQERIAARKKEEDSQGVSWRRFGISAELRALEARNSPKSSSSVEDSSSSGRTPRRRGGKKRKSSAVLY